VQALLSPAGRFSAPCLENKKREDQAEGGGATWSSPEEERCFLPALIITCRTSGKKAVEIDFFKKISVC
jgi:hypothetical protein